MTKGKNFSCNNVEGKRKKSDFYETPFSLTEQLLDKEDLFEPILEPACGMGAITKVLSKRYKDIISYDLSTGTDFLNETRKFRTIITNPPFSLAFEFIQKAKELCPNCYFLLPLSYLHGKKRFDLLYSYGAYPLKQIYVFTRYPMLGDALREDGKYKTGMMVLAWYHFSKHHRDKPQISWLDNNQYVLGKGDL